MPDSHESGGAAPERWRVTDGMAMLASLGNKCSVTLLVQGTVISGLLVPVEEYFRWFSGEAAEQLLKGEDPDEIVLQGVSLADILTPGSRRRFICIQDAEIQGGAPVTWVTYPYLLVDADHVGACTPAATGALPEELEG